MLQSVWMVSCLLSCINSIALHQLWPFLLNIPAPLLTFISISFRCDTTSAHCDPATCLSAFSGAGSSCVSNPPSCWSFSTLTSEMEMINRPRSLPPPLRLLPRRPVQPSPLRPRFPITSPKSMFVVLQPVGLVALVPALGATFTAAARQVATVAQRMM